MKEHVLAGETLEQVRQTLSKDPYLRNIQPHELDNIFSYAQVFEYDVEEFVFRSGKNTTNLIFIIQGSAVVLKPHTKADGYIESERIEAIDILGAEDILLQQPHSTSLLATSNLFTLQLKKDTFSLLMHKYPAFAQRVSLALAKRLQTKYQEDHLPKVPAQAIEAVNQQVIGLLSIDQILSNQVLPLNANGRTLKLGCVSQPNQQLSSHIQEMLPGIQILYYRLEKQVYEKILKQFGIQRPTAPPLVMGSLSSDVTQTSSATLPMASQDNNFIASQNSNPALSQNGIPQFEMFTNLLQQLIKQEQPTPPTSRPRFETIEAIEKVYLSSEEKERRLSKILPLLQKMAHNQASDLHLSAKQKPRWRIDGDLIELSDYRPLGEKEVLYLLEGMMPDRCLREFDRDNQVDFSYSIDNLARYRVNMYREGNGISAALRQITIEIPTAQELRLPEGAIAMTRLTKGLILVTGPTGSGKSSTLAALVHTINKRSAKHIITLEDPIEFVHTSLKSLIHQREVGPHTNSFSDALRSALREDPDIVLVGELRDYETMSLAIETAQTGHLVFGTLHTNNVTSTIDRISSLFPHEEQAQVLMSLSDVLKGIISQTLCKKVGGGRVAAFEVLSVSGAVSNIIRQGKTHQLGTAMVGNKENVILNQHLEELVRAGLVDAQEAMYRAIEKEELKLRIEPYLLRSRKKAALLREAKVAKSMNRTQPIKKP